MSKWTQGKVVTQKEWAPGLYSLFIEAPILPFVAGQFTQISVDESQKLFRPYSFANAPFEPILEFYYDLISGGKLSPFLAKLHPGDIAWVGTKAAGRFVLADVADAQTLWLFATGTGFGVFLSLLKTSEAWERFEHIVLVHSVRKVNSLTHYALIERWRQQYPGRFHWIPIVTREKVEGIFCDRMSVLLQTGKLEEMTQLPLTRITSQVMLCGNPVMVTDVSHLLEIRGLQMNRPHHPGHITVENYWKA